MKLIMQFVTILRSQPCPICGGSGKQGNLVCQSCGGRGVIGHP